MYTEHAFLDRFAAAAADGFAAVEFMFPYEHPRAEIARPPGRSRPAAGAVQRACRDAGAGERGIACLSARRDAFRRGILEQALPYALALKCPRVHVMAGVMPAGTERPALRAVVRGQPRLGGARAASVGVDLMIEPINKRDVPGYLLNRQDDAHEIVEEVGAPNLKVHMDLYHCQIVEGDLAMKLRKLPADTARRHLQIAGVPTGTSPISANCTTPICSS